MESGLSPHLYLSSKNLYISSKIAIGEIRTGNLIKKNET